MKNPFQSFRHSYYIKDHITNPNIEVGECTYYSGFYHGRHFEENVWYLDSECQNKLIIGKFCSIATGAIFMMSGNQGHRYDWISCYPFYEFPEENWTGSKNAYQDKGDTIVGNDVWIGAEAMIMPGVNIANGAVIAARSVVTKNVEPYAIVGGNPAKIIKKRFSEEKIAQLMQVKWWDWDIDKIKSHMSVLCSDRFEELN